mgnify:CR=1 FL=1
MKKLTLAISALAAAFGASAAKADVSVSGSGSAAYIAPAGSGDSKLNVGQFVSFGLSTTTASGMTITGGMGLSNTITTNAGQAVSGGQTLTFATGGATITVGDVTANDTPGDVGGVVGGQVGDNGALNSNVGSGFVDDDGLGVAFSTAVGGSTLSFTYVVNDDTDTLGAINTAGANALMGAGITVPMGAMTVTVGVADSDTGETSSGASVSAAIGGGTLAVGYSTLYGDMCGSFAPLKDLYKTEVFNLAENFANRNLIAIPQAVIERLPTAELSPDQYDICLLYTSPSPRDQRGSRLAAYA